MQERPNNTAAIKAREITHQDPRDRIADLTWCSTEAEEGSVELSARHGTVDGVFEVSYLDLGRRRRPRGAHGVSSVHVAGGACGRDPSR